MRDSSCATPRKIRAAAASGGVRANRSNRATLSSCLSGGVRSPSLAWRAMDVRIPPGRSEEHTSELQSRLHLVCRLLLEKKKKQSQVQSPFQEINMSTH